MRLELRIGSGRVLLPADTYATYFGGASSAALIERDGAVWLLPLAGPTAGGLLLKQCNLKGDRAMVAPDFLAAYGLGGFAPERRFEVRWVSAAGALRIEGLVRP
jgi:hypothetical protein